MLLAQVSMGLACIRSNSTDLQEMPSSKVAFLSLAFLMTLARGWTLEVNCFIQDETYVLHSSSPALLLISKFFAICLAVTQRLYITCRHSSCHPIGNGIICALVLMQATLKILNADSLLHSSSASTQGGNSGSSVQEWAELLWSSPSNSSGTVAILAMELPWHEFVKHLPGYSSSSAGYSSHH